MKKLFIMALFITCVLIISGCGTLTYTGDFCEDEIIDRDETDVDCGGQYCDACDIGRMCKENNDCVSGNCISEICAEAADDGTSIADADSDGVADAEDVCEGFDDAIDTDADTVPDGCDDDIDGDGLTDAEEVEYGTDPELKDTDGDNLTDYEEVTTYITDPLDEDTDDDGYSDGKEVTYHLTDPLDSADYPTIVTIERGSSESVTVSGQIYYNIGLSDVSGSDDGLEYCGFTIYDESEATDDGTVTQIGFEETVVMEGYFVEITVIDYDSETFTSCTIEVAEVQE